MELNIGTSEKDISNRILSSFFFFFTSHDSNFSGYLSDYYPFLFTLLTFPFFVLSFF